MTLIESDTAGSLYIRTLAEMGCSILVLFPALVVDELEERYALPFPVYRPSFGS